MPNDDIDPHPNPARFHGKACSFDLPSGSGAVRRVAGTIECQEYIGRTKRGAIPDYLITVRGATGRRVKVSLVESYTTITNEKP